MGTFLYRDGAVLRLLPAVPISKQSRQTMGTVLRRGLYGLRSRSADVDGRFVQNWAGRGLVDFGGLVNGQ